MNEWKFLFACDIEFKELIIDSLFLFFLISFRNFDVNHLIEI